MNRREFLHVLAMAAASGLAFNSKAALANTISGMYDLPTFGNNVTLLHFTDSHAQLLPSYYREPSVNIGVGDHHGKPPHLVGEALLKHFRISPTSRQAYAFSSVNFEAAAKTYGKVGGFAHLATLVKKIRAQRPDALLLDGGDTWQGSATAMWTKGQDMVDATKLLEVDVMTGHWEFTLGQNRVKEIVRDLEGKIDFVAQNVRTADGKDAIFKPYVIKDVNGIPVAIIGQAFPYTPIMHPRHLTADWAFGISEETLQKTVTEAAAKGAKVIVLLSHNGMGIDLKLASRVSGIDVILGGHSHDAVPQPTLVKNAGGYTLVANGGANGKFLGVLDLQVNTKGHVAGYQYKLLPVFSNMLEADKAMSELIRKVRAPYAAKLGEKLAMTEGALYRRGNFNGTFDQLILDAMIEVKDAQIALMPGFRWGATVMPNQAITLENVMDQTAISYPQTSVTEMTGEAIKAALEDVCDNVFNADPYSQHGGDMLRVGGLDYTCNPEKKIGSRISGLTFKGKPLDADKKYKVASWASNVEAAETKDSEPIWDVVTAYLKQKKKISMRKISQPKLVGMERNPGIA
ncbi:MAG: thiosulfohydrolase SoxB [Burkholderiales bacterium]|nr:thiosulfohydrolase SoxB [Burkholderiales bacterium]